MIFNLTIFVTFSKLYTQGVSFGMISILKYIQLPHNLSILNVPGRLAYQI